MGDWWLTMGQEEILSPYSEPPWDYMDSWVTDR